MIPQDQGISQNQKGAALFLMVLVLLVGGVSLLFKAGGGNRGAIDENNATRLALAQAKELAISFAVANLAAPGGLPFPDRNADGNYDGSGDCVTAGFNPTQHLLGKWPFRTEDGCGMSVPAFGKPLQDGGGEVLWYTVSAGLVRSVAGGYPVINSEILGNNWFTVVNGQGAVLTNRAALVIMAPGRVVQAQSRAGAVAAAQFLEGVTVGGVSYTNYAIEAGDTGFVAQAADTAFNDQLIYATIEELMAVVEKRVLAQGKALVREYRNSCGQYPWPRPYTNPRTAPNFNSVAGTVEGLLPVGVALPVNWGTGCAAGISIPAWMTANRWHHLSYYAVGSGAVQAGAGCTAGLDCLTVTGWAMPDNNKEAVVLQAGDALTGQNRAAAAGLGDYFEAANAVALDRLFTVQGAAPFNDRLEVVR
ncbi:MAG: hypothetical protein V1706_07730 [Pseudomonadota bacterium]